MSYIIHMKRKPALVWDEWNRNHIKKHKATVNEAEEAYQRSEIITKVRDGKIGIISRITNGRMLVIYLSFAKQKLPYIVSARDAGVKERRIYYGQKK